MRMATSFQPGPSDSRQGTSSPRPKGRENTRNTLCRNIKIYGFCRSEQDGCMYAHDVTTLNNRLPADDGGHKKKLNVDSPAFTPAVLDNTSSNNNAAAFASNTTAFAGRGSTISPKAAIAAPFMPKTSKVGTATPPITSSHHSSEWSSHDIPEFIPQGFHGIGDQRAPVVGTDSFNPYAETSTYTDLDGSAQNPHLNPYANDMGTAATGPFYQAQNTFTQPLQYHLYAPVGPHRDKLHAYERTVHDFFIPENLRQELQRKAEATLQTLPNSNLPANMEYFHSLVPLDTSNQKSSSSFGYNSWLYKATSSKDGHTYAVRRIEGFRLTSERAIRTVQQTWSRVYNGGIVTFQDCFTTRAFGDSSLVFVSDYHPLSKTLAEQHLSSPANMNKHRSPTMLVAEQVLWSYIVQIASALKAIHSVGLAARTISPTKVILTNKNRIRLSGCAILDVVQSNDNRPLAMLQQEDLQQLGHLMLVLATGMPKVTANAKSVETMTRSYSVRLRECIMSLMDNPRDIDTFLVSIADQVTSSLDSFLQLEDTLYGNLSKELENGRLVRLLTKLGFINERPEGSETTQGPGHISNSWSETGERYYLKLFRDYVFHQVSQDGRPVLDLGHVLTCLNKLDAGSDEKVTLVSRDEQNVFIVSFKEVKRGLENSFQELIKASRRN